MPRHAAKGPWLVLSPRGAWREWGDRGCEPSSSLPGVSPPPHLTSPSLSTGSPESMPRAGEPQDPERPGGVRSVHNPCSYPSQSLTLALLLPACATAARVQLSVPRDCCHRPSLLKAANVDPTQEGSILSSALLVYLRRRALDGQ